MNTAHLEHANAKHGDLRAPTGRLGQLAVSSDRRTARRRHQPHGRHDLRGAKPRAAEQTAWDVNEDEPHVYVRGTRKISDLQIDPLAWDTQHGLIRDQDWRGRAATPLPADGSSA